MIKHGIVFLFDILQTVVLAAAIFVIIYLFIAQPHLVKGSSMEPNFHNGDYILTEKISYRFRDPERGEVIVFQAPNRPDADYIKRIIALPKDTVAVKNGRIYVNDQPLPEQYEPDTFQTLPGRFLQENQVFTVPDGSYFVLGDNRSHSSDSREFGTVDRGAIVGRAMFRYWPANQFGKIAVPSYALQP